VPAAAVDAERLPLRGRAVGAAELERKLEDVAGGRAAPAVDGLVRISDGGDGEAHRRGADASGEQLPQQARLGRGGVLVFVEEHDGEPLAQLLTHLRHERHEPHGLAQLVGELDDAEAPLQLLVVLDEPEQLLPLRGGRDR
jgi:hypothetical protein